MKLLKRIAITCGVIIIVICVADVTLVFGIAHWRPEVKKSDAVIVLGAAINTPALYNRTRVGLDLYENGDANTLVLSGGKIAEADISEAQYMEKVVKRNKTEPVTYMLEDQSHNTFENIRDSKALLGNADSVIIVSDQFHLARGVLLAYRAGFKHVSWAAPEPSYYSDKDLRFYYFREMVAMISYIPTFIVWR